MLGALGRSETNDPSPAQSQPTHFAATIAEIPPFELFSAIASNIRLCIADTLEPFPKAVSVGHRIEGDSNRL